MQITPAEITHKKTLTGKYIPNNCVLFARSVRPDLPQPLYTLEQKRRIAKKKTPEVGDVAITNESWSGHLAIVIKVEKENILIKESGYSAGITTRWIPIDMPIGYF